MLELKTKPISLKKKNVSVDKPFLTIKDLKFGEKFVFVKDSKYRDRHDIYMKCSLYQCDTIITNLDKGFTFYAILSCQDEQVSRIRWYNILLHLIRRQLGKTHVGS